MQSELEHDTIRSIAGSTNHIGDKHKCLAALAYARSRGIDRQVALGIVLDKRYQWLNWLTKTQRQWQIKTRNPNKARHIDSIELREKYVRYL